MTSYKTYKLSDPECRNAKPKAKLYRLRDGGGLFACSQIYLGTQGCGIYSACTRFVISPRYLESYHGE